LSTKIHARVDALGNPTALMLSDGQAHDLVGADALLSDVQEGTTLIADKGYDAEQRVVQPLIARGCAVVIPSRAGAKQPRACDKHLYRARHVVENFFAKLKQYRAIATRYDKTACNFLGGVLLAASVIWLA
jgi:transposase